MRAQDEDDAHVATIDFTHTLGVPGRLHLSNGIQAAFHAGQDFNTDEDLVAVLEASLRIAT
eukprot:1430755-Prorocentrum_lima.AAC.1